MLKKTVNRKDLMDLGFPEHTASNIIRQAKRIAVIRYEEISQKQQNMIKYACSPFNNKAVHVAPRQIVEELLGFSLVNEETLDE